MVTSPSTLYSPSPSPSSPTSKVLLSLTLPPFPENSRRSLPPSPLRAALPHRPQPRRPPRLVRHQQRPLPLLLLFHALEDGQGEEGRRAGGAGGQGRCYWEMMFVLLGNLEFGVWFVWVFWEWEWDRDGDREKEREGVTGLDKDILSWCQGDDLGWKSLGFNIPLISLDFL